MIHASGEEWVLIFLEPFGSLATGVPTLTASSSGVRETGGAFPRYGRASGRKCDVVWLHFPNSGVCAYIYIYICNVCGCLLGVSFRLCPVSGCDDQKEANHSRELVIPFIPHLRASIWRHLGQSLRKIS